MPLPAIERFGALFSNKRTCVCAIASAARRRSDVVGVWRCT